MDHPRLGRRHAGLRKCLECPICLELCPTSSNEHVLQCPNGHIICQGCYDAVQRCPICRVHLPRPGTRSLVAEHMAEELRKVLDRVGSLELEQTPSAPDFPPAGSEESPPSPVPSAPPPPPQNELAVPATQRYQQVSPARHNPRDYYLIVVGGKCGDGTRSKDLEVLPLDPFRPNAPLKRFKGIVERDTGKTPIRHPNHDPQYEAASPADTHYKVMTKCWRSVLPTGYVGTRYEPSGVATKAKYWAATALDPNLGYVFSGGWNETAVEYSLEDSVDLVSLPLMPSSKNRHCMAAFDGGRKLFVTGGNDARTFILDVDSGVWEEVAPIPTVREFAACGVCVRRDGSEVVVAGGGLDGHPCAVVEIYSVRTGEWRRAASELRKPLQEAAAVPAFGRTFLLVGGQTAGGEKSDVVFEYSPLCEYFTRLEARLKEPKSQVTAIVTQEPTAFRDAAEEYIYDAMYSDHV